MPSFAKHAYNVFAMQREYGGSRPQKAGPRPTLEEQHGAYLAGAFRRLGMRDDDDDDFDSPSASSQSSTSASSSREMSSSSSTPSPRHRQRSPTRSILKPTPPPLPERLLRPVNSAGRPRSQSDIRDDVERFRQYDEYFWRRQSPSGDTEEDSDEREKRFRKRLEDLQRFENSQREQRRRRDILRRYSLSMDKYELEVLEREMAMQDYYARYGNFQP